MLGPEDGFSEQRADATNPQGFQGQLTHALTPQCFTPPRPSYISLAHPREKSSSMQIGGLPAPKRNNFAANLFLKRLKGHPRLKITFGRALGKSVSASALQKT